jgi:hypothetical protein
LFWISFFTFLFVSFRFLPCSLLISYICCRPGLRWIFRPLACSVAHQALAWRPQGVVHAALWIAWADMQWLC